MTTEDLSLAIDRNFDQVVPKDAVSRIGTYADAVIGLAAGPALIAVLALADELAWQGVVGAVALSIAMGGLGLSHASSKA